VPVRTEYCKKITVSNGSGQLSFNILNYWYLWLSDL